MRSTPGRPVDIHSVTSERISGSESRAMLCGSALSFNNLRRTCVTTLSAYRICRRSTSGSAKEVAGFGRLRLGFGFDGGDGFIFDLKLNLFMVRLFAAQL